MRTIGVVTVGRSDFGIYQPVLRAIDNDPELKLHLIVSGAHFAPEFGTTVNEIISQGFAIGDRVEMLLAADTPEAIAKSMGLGMIGFAQSYARQRPDILVVLGDRFEMHAAAAAAVPFKIPLAHLHGGEVTHGAIDDALRHAMTKYSHLHFVATSQSADRVIQLGEEPWRVTVCGAPSLDNLQSLDWMTREEISRRLEMVIDAPPLLVTYHPVTLQYEQASWQIDQLLAALEEIRMPIVITKPNADTNGRVISQQIQRFAAGRVHVRVVDNLGTRAYFSVMRIAAAMVGNSSSGIIEAASFGLPVVNIGIRQQGRARSGNVLDVGENRDEIAAGIRRALQPEFRDRLAALTNVYGAGNAAAVIVDRLKSVPLDDNLIIKRFHDLPGPTRSPTATQVPT